MPLDTRSHVNMYVHTNTNHFTNESRDGLLFSSHVLCPAHALNMMNLCCWDLCDAFVVSSPSFASGDALRWSCGCLTCADNSLLCGPVRVRETVICTDRASKQAQTLYIARYTTSTIHHCDTDTQVASTFIYKHKVYGKMCAVRVQVSLRVFVCVCWFVGL